MIENVRNAKLFVMIAQKEMQFLIQGGPGRTAEPRSKYYEGYFCLQLAVGGEVKLSYDRKVSRHGGPVMWLSYPGPHITHEPVEPGKSWTHRYLAFCGPLAQHWWQTGLLPREPVELKEEASWAARFDELLRYPLSARRAWDHEEKINRLEHLFLRLVRLHEGEKEAPWLREAKRLLGDSRRFHPDIAETARAVNMGESTFRRKFKEATGRSPQNWFIDQRMETARELLEEDRLSINEIADRLGYPSVYQFSKQFKSASALSPRQWRNARLYLDEPSL